MVLLLQTELSSSNESSGAFSTSSRNSSSSSSTSSDSPDDRDSPCSYRCLRNFSQEKDDHSSSVFCLALHQELLCAGLANNQVFVWKNTTAAQVAKLKSSPHAGAVKAILMTGDKLFSAHQDHKIRVWRVSTQNQCRIATLPASKDLAKSFVFSSRNRVQHTDVVSSLTLGEGVLYSGSWDRTVKIWRLSDFKFIDSFVAHEGAIKSLVADIDKGLLFTASEDSTIKIWERRKGKHDKHYLVAVLQRPESFSSINALALNSPSSVLYAASSDSCISVWESEDGNTKQLKLNTLLRGHQQSVLCLATLDDLVCSGSADTTIRLWRRGSDASHTCLSIVRDHKAPVKSLVLAMDRFGFCNIYSAGLDSQAKMWRVTYHKAEQELESSENGGRSSEHYYFNCSSNAADDREADAIEWKLNSIKCALEEGSAHFRLVFETLQS